MRNTRTTTITILIAALTALGATGISLQPRAVQATAALVQPAPPVDPTPTPCPDAGPEAICVLPSDTDGRENDNDCAVAIGCEDHWRNPNGEQSDANNNLHYLYLPPSLTDTGKLLVLFGGGEGSSGGISTDIGPFAAGLGYHVIGLTYPSAPANSCGNVNCFGDAFHEVVTGEERSPSAGGDKTTVGEHPQDSIANRLLKLLLWADANYPDDGWDQYLIHNTPVAAVDWTKVHIGGHSNGSSHSSYMGTLARFQDIGRVSLFGGPDDGKDGNGTTEETWNPATYIQDTQGNTGNRYYGLVHYLNKARKIRTGELNEPPPAYQVFRNWHTFGMEGPNNQDRFDEFDPDPSSTPNFGNAHMLISIDPERDRANPTDRGTTKAEAHNSVVHNVYCVDEEEEEDGDVNQDGNPGDHHCEEFGDPVAMKIGYEPAWACVLGSGDYYASSEPVANAGPAQTVECTGNGGATVDLDGSHSSDLDCDILTYAWSGPWGTAEGRNPAVFFPLGVNSVELVASDDWLSSLFPATTQITVADTQPPSLQVSLTPILLWPPNHRMVRIDATVIAADSCGGTPPHVVLTSIMSDEPDNGLGDGDRAQDIQDAQIGTLDQSFLLRAERAGGSPNGRTYTITYTATDASGNQTPAVATVRVPH